MLNKLNRILVHKIVQPLRFSKAFTHLAMGINNNYNARYSAHQY